MPQLGKKAIGGAAAAAAAVLTMSAPAFAAHTISTSTINVGSGFVSQPVDVNVSGLSGNPSFNIALCNNDQGADFDPTFDCDLIGSRQSISLLADGSRVLTGTTTPFQAFAVRSIPLDPDADWRCAPDGTTDGATVVTAGQRVYSTCRVRVWTGGLTDTTSQSFQNVTFQAVTPPPTTTAPPTTTTAPGPDPVVPEAPYAALLPLGAVAVLGGGYLIVRNRKPVRA